VRRTGQEVQLRRPITVVIKGQYEWEEAQFWEALYISYEIRIPCAREKSESNRTRFKGILCNMEQYEDIDSSHQAIQGFYRSRGFTLGVLHSVTCTSTNRGGSRRGVEFNGAGSLADVCEGLHSVEPFGLEAASLAAALMVFV
jgi:hypothetical protein